MGERSGEDERVALADEVRSLVLAHADLVDFVSPGQRDFYSTFRDTPFEALFHTLPVSRMLRERGLLVTAIRPPTVPAGSARLRVTLSAAHSEAQVQLLLNALAECYPLLESADA